MKTQKIILSKKARTLRVIPKNVAQPPIQASTVPSESILWACLSIH